MRLLIKMFPYAIAFTLGCIWALITRSIAFFEYENKFNIFELFYFVMSAGIALFITSRIDDALQRRRSQKDLIMKKMEEVDFAIKDLHKMFVFENNKYKLPNTPFLSEVKNIGMWAKRYERSITNYYKNLEDKVGYKKINTRKLVRIYTSTRGETGDNISCNNDIWFYSENKFVEIKKELENLRNICYVNMILLNDFV